MWITNMHTFVILWIEFLHSTVNLNAMLCIPALIFLCARYCGNYRKSLKSELPSFHLSYHLLLWSCPGSCQTSNQFQKNKTSLFAMAFGTFSSTHANIYANVLTGLCIRLLFSLCVTVRIYCIYSLLPLVFLNTSWNTTPISTALPAE